MKAFRREIVEALARASGAAPEEIDSLLVVPPKPDMGDFAFPCFQLAKKARTAPPVLAQDLAAKLKSGLTLVKSIEAAGPYVNFRLDPIRLAKEILKDAILPSYGRSEEGSGKTVCIDYSSPNIAKPFHVGHIRSTIIGGALYRLFETLGYKPVGINHLGDWGTQFGKQIVGIKKWGKPSDASDLMALNRLYVKFHEEVKSNPALDDEAREWFRKQEAGDKEAVELWRVIRETSLDYYKKLYDRLGVRFDAFIGESFFNDKMEPVVAEAKAKGLTSVSNGALIIDLSKHGIKTPALLKKADGATLYMTRDLAAAKYRNEQFQFDRMLYVVGTAQELHFRQLFQILKLMGYGWADRCVHVKFGMVLGMSTREGNVVYLEELLDEAHRRALAYMRERVRKQADDVDEKSVAESVGIAAILFSDLSRQRIKDYTFQWDDAISLDGDTGPYLMNAHARIAGIIRKCGVELDAKADVAPLTEPEAHELVTWIGRYSERLSEAAKFYEPAVLAAYLLELARALHAAYEKLPVKDQETKIAKARLLLFASAKNVLASGLRILGITPLDRM